VCCLFRRTPVTRSRPIRTNHSLIITTLVMHLSSALAAVAVAVPFVAAGPAIPRLAGLNVRDLKARNMLTNMFERADLAAAEHHKARGNVESRQNTDGQCGPGFGSCAPGYCCSQEGCTFLPLTYLRCNVDVSSLWPRPQFLRFPRMPVQLWTRVSRQYHAIRNQPGQRTSHKSRSRPIWRRRRVRVYHAW
jgi:hypothetical protein